MKITLLALCFLMVGCTDKCPPSKVAPGDDICLVPEYTEAYIVQGETVTFRLDCAVSGGNMGVIERIDGVGTVAADQDSLTLVKE